MVGVLGLVTLSATPAAAGQAAPACPQAGTNLLVNGGFERPADGVTGQPAGWTADSEAPPAALSWDRAVSHTGRASVRIESTEPADLWWVQQVAVAPHTLYRLTGWIRTAGVQRSPESLDAGANLSFLGTWDHSIPVLGTQGWRQIALTVDSGDASQLTVAARLGFWSGTTAGTAWFDDLSLTRLTTGTGQLRNGGFERGGARPNALPADWDQIEDQGLATLRWDHTTTRNGHRSVRISASEATDAMWVQTIPVDQHTRYQLSGWIRTENVVPSSGVVQAGANLSFLGTYEYAGVFGTQDWVRVSVTLDSGDATHLTIAARLGYWWGETSGTAWFDDLTLTRLG